jgi:hypothetical protein
MAPSAPFPRVAVAALLWLVTAGTCWGQAVSGSQVSGVVRDTSGGVLPGATVTATNTATGLAQTVFTNHEGAYVVPNLPVGPYRLTVSLEGFSTYVQDGIVLQVNSNPTIDVTLSVGAIGEQVNVVAAAAMVDTRGTGVGQLIEEKQIVNLPLNGRQPTQLILLSGAAVVTTSGNLVGDRRQYPSSVSISVAGGAGNATSYLVDGGYNNDPLANISQPFPFPDALQEFKVENGVRPARYGILPGATVNAVTKSGTNAFRGALFEFVRDSRFNAIRPFTSADDGLNRNQWGGTLGGPIARNRAFFFGAVQMTRLRVHPTDTTSFVPSAKMRAGDFTEAASPACNAGNQLTLPAPFVDNRVDPALFSPVAVSMLKYLPVSNDPCGRISYNVPDNSDEQLVVTRADWQVTPEQRVFGRYFLANYDRPAQYDGTNLLMATGNGLGLDNRVQTGVFAYDSAISGSLFGSTRVAFARSRIRRLQGESLFTGRDIGANISPMATDPGFTFLMTTITNGWPGPAFPGRFESMTWQISQDFDWARGAHQFAFGGMWVRPRLDAMGPFQANGWYTFNGSRAGAGRLGLADFLLGLPSQYRQGGIQDIQQYMNYVGAYVQDTWRASNRLTVNLGVRWEPYYSAVDLGGYASHFDLDRFFAGERSRVHTNAPPGLMYPGDPGYPGKSYNRNQLKQFAPRVGVVYDPGGDGRQTIRAAVGLFYEMPKMWQYGRAPLNPPFGNTIIVNNPASFADPWATYPGGNPFPLKKPVPSDVTYPLFGSFVNMPLDAKPTQLQQWNVSYERQLGAHWLVSVAYIGNHTIHLWLGREINPAIYVPGASTLANTNVRRVLYLANPAQGQYFADIPTTDDGATGRYNGMVLAVNRRFADNWSLLSNFTWSKCVNDGDPGIDITNFYPDPNDRSTNRGPCNSDRRYMFNASLVWQSVGMGSGIARALTSGWQVGVIVVARSGAPFTPSMATNNALTGLNNQRPIVVGDPKVSDQSTERWFDPKAFAPNTPGVWGSATRGMIRGPAYYNTDVALTRSFTLGGGRRLETRVEAFNALNRFQPGDPVVDFASTNFGKIVTAEDPRILQFAVKFTF